MNLVVWTCGIIWAGNLCWGNQRGSCSVPCSCSFLDSIWGRYCKQYFCRLLVTFISSLKLLLVYLLFSPCSLDFLLEAQSVLFMFFFLLGLMAAFLSSFKDCMFIICLLCVHLSTFWCISFLFCYCRAQTCRF